MAHFKRIVLRDQRLMDTHPSLIDWTKVYFPSPARRQTNLFIYSKAFLGHRLSVNQIFELGCMQGGARFQEVALPLNGNWCGDLAEGFMWMVLVDIIRIATTSPTRTILISFIFGLLCFESNDVSCHFFTTALRSNSTGCYQGRMWNPPSHSGSFAPKASRPKDRSR